MDLRNPQTDAMATRLSRRSILKGSVTLTAAAIAGSALAIGTIEIGAPVAEQAAIQIAEWYEEVGGI